MGILLQETDVGQADGHQPFPGVVGHLAQNLMLHLMPLLVDVMEDGQDIVIFVLKMLVGRRAGHTAAGGDPSDGKILYPVKPYLLDTSQ